MTRSDLSTISVTREVAEQVKQLANKTGMTHLETATQLLQFALNSGSVTFKTREFAIVPKDLLDEGEDEEQKTPKRRPRRRKS